MAKTPARITLYRQFWPLNDVLRSYKIVIDGHVVGWIGRRQTKSFDVTPGHHQIRLEIDWCRSEDVDLELSPGEEVKLSCKADWTSYTAFLQPSSYIHLRVVGEGARAAAS